MRCSLVLGVFLLHSVQALEWISLESRLLGRAFGNQKSEKTTLQAPTSVALSTPTATATPTSHLDSSLIKRWISLPMNPLFMPMKETRLEEFIDRANSEEKYPFHYILKLEKVDNGGFPVEHVKLGYFLSDPQIKVVLKAVMWSDSDAAYNLSLAEARICLSLPQHPHILPCSGIAYDRVFHRGYIVSEYCQERDLITAMDKYAFGKKRIQSFFAQMMRGLSHLHSFHIAHRDIKPDNLFLNSRFILKIADFGLSIKVDNATQVQTAPTGSIHFAAPEMFAINYLSKLPKSEQASLIESMEDADDFGNSRIPELAKYIRYYPFMADIWSAGMTYYAMRTRRYPWYKATLLDSNFKRFLDHPQRFWARQKRQDKKDGVQWADEELELVISMLSFDPSQRPTVHDILQDPWMRQISKRKD